MKNENSQKTIKEYRYYVSGIKINGTDYTVKAAIAVDENGNRYYDHALTQIEKGKLLDYAARVTSTPPHQGVHISEYKDKRLLSILQINPNNISKVVDENGEPLAVAHSTDRNFTVFKNKQENDSGWLGAGYYFFGDRSLDGQYGENVMETFLNIRNPYYASDEDIKRLSELNDNAESEHFVQEVQEEGYDGVYYNGNLNQEIVAFNPAQIKSAIANNGNFDTRSDDIRFQAAGEKGAQAIVLNILDQQRNPKLSGEKSQSFPTKIGGIELTPEQRIALANGETIKMIGLSDKSGNKCTSDIRWNPQERKIKYINCQITTLNIALKEKPQQTRDSCRKKM